MEIKSPFLARASNFTNANNCITLDRIFRAFKQTIFFMYLVEYIIQEHLYLGCHFSATNLAQEKILSDCFNSLFE